VLFWLYAVVSGASAAYELQPGCDGLRPARRAPEVGVEGGSPGLSKIPLK
jgi:hypothetical protein